MGNRNAAVAHDVVKLQVVVNKASTMAMFHSRQQLPQVRSHLPSGKLVKVLLLILQNTLLANQLGWINEKCKYGKNGKKARNSRCKQLLALKVLRQKEGNTAFCNHVF